MRVIYSIDAASFSWIEGMRVAVIGLRGVPHVIGGVETHCANLYPELARLPGAPEFILMTRSRYQPNEVDFDESVKIVRMWSPKARRLETAVYTFTSILYARFALKCDSICLHGIGPGFFSPLASMLGLKAIVTHHGPDYLRPKWGFFERSILRLGEASSYRFSKGLICVSAAIKDDLESRFGSSSSKVVVIKNGISPWPSEERPADTFLSGLGIAKGKYVLAVGRLDATKAFHELIEAFDRRQRGDEDLKLVIVGSGPDNDGYVEDLLSNAAADVVFVGYREGWELRSLYRNCALFAHPSHMEGYGIVVAEAMAARCPIILSDIPAHREFSLPSESYFEPGNIHEISKMLDRSNFSELTASDYVTSTVIRSWSAIAQRQFAFMMSCGLLPSHF